jgi:hypothetical protein
MLKRDEASENEVSKPTLSTGAEGDSDDERIVEI